MSRINYELLHRTGDFVNYKPELHEQETWVDGNIEGTPNSLFEGNVCGATACFAGWASIFAGWFQVAEAYATFGDRIVWVGGAQVVNPATQEIDFMENVGQKELGLTEGQADCMFYGANSLDQINEMIKALDADENANLYRLYAMYHENVLSLGEEYANNRADEIHADDMKEAGIEV